MIRKKFFILVCILTFALTLNGCSTSSGEETTAASETEAASETAQSVEEETGGATETAAETSAAETESQTGETADEASSAAETETAEEETEAAQSEWTWQHDAPENHGVDTAMLETLHAGLDEVPVLTSVIVKDGYIVDEYYKDGYNADSVFVLNSCSKSVTSALIGIAIDEGYIESVDVPISEYFPQLLESDSPYAQEITIWNLLTHTSGIDFGDTEYWDAWRGSDNWVEFALNQLITSEPGTVFNYSTAGTHLLSAILQEATGMTAYEFGKEHLFDPVGMDSVECSTDAQGISDGGNGFAMNVYDMAKFGWLYLNDGVWEGEQIVPAEWVEESTSLQYDRSTGSADYGYQWWVRTFGDQNYDAFFGQGHAGQYIFVVPELELVVAMTSDYTGPTSIYWDFVNNIVNGCEG